MKKLIMNLGIIGLSAFILYSLGADENFVVLKNVKLNENVISMSLSGKTKYHAFTISNPPRLIVEFTNTEHDWKQKQLDVEGNYIKRIRSGQFQNEPVKIARVVLDLNKMVEYKLRGEGKTVTLTINPKENSDELEDLNLDINNDISTTQIADSTINSNNNSFEEEDSFEESIKQDKSIKQDNNSSISDLNSDLSSDIDTAFNGVTTINDDFEEPIETEKPAYVPQKTAAEPAAEKTTMKVAKQATQKYTPPVKKVIKKKVIKKTKKSKSNKNDKSKYMVDLPRKPISVDFEEADVRDVFRILSLKSGINIIYGSDVAGSLTMHLENVPFNKAFETILSIKGLVSQALGDNIIRIATPQKIAEERSQAVTFTKIFPLNYAKAEEVKINLDTIRTAEGRKGNISIDSRTNSLVVTDTPEGLLAVEKIVAELDQKPPQVLIESKLVEVIFTDNFDMGIQWQYASNAYSEGNLDINIGNTTAETSSVGEGVTAAQAANIVRPNAPALGGTGVSFPASPVSGQIGQIAFGVMVDNNMLTGLLSALSQKGLSKILSNPRVTTINNQEAKILIGERVPFSNVTIGEGGITTTTTEWVEVGIKLQVVPTINTDQQITLKIQPEVSLVTNVTAAGPVIASREADTTVMVRNSETVVIGGLIREEDRKLGTQVPLLGELPVIGHLFRRDYNTKERSELLVFITPQIIE